MHLSNPKACDVCIAFLGNKVSDRTLRALSGKDAEQENLNVWQASGKFPKSSRRIIEITTWDSIFGWIMLINRDFFMRRDLKDVCFPLFRMQGTSSIYCFIQKIPLFQQEWKALMANFAWENPGCWDGQTGLTWEQWLETVPGSLSQKTATCGHLCHIWSGTLPFPYRLKSVLPFPTGKIFSGKPEQAAYRMKELLGLVFIEQLVFSDVSFSSFPPTFFFLPLFWCSDT